MNDHSSDSENEDDYVELADEALGDSGVMISQPGGRQCLFCSDQSSVDSYDLINRHLPGAHSIANFGSLLANAGLRDQAAWVRFVTFVRRKNLQSGSDATPQQLLEQFRVADAVLDGDGHNGMPPPGPPIDDPIMYELDIDDLLLADASVSARNQQSQQLADNRDQRIKELEMLVESLRGQIAGMSTVLRRFALGGGSDAVDAGSEASPAQRTIAELNDDEDEYYVDSYGGDSIHAEMLQDRVRTGAYHDFICGNPSLFNGRTVMDVGCGTGILSMFSARSGASNVLAVDCANVLSHAKLAAHDNGLADRISFHQGKLEQLDELRGVKVDAVVSEWMGYCLLYEGMLESVLYARDHCLKPGGAVYPRVCNLLLCGIDSDELYQRNALYFDNVYGVRLSYLKERCLTEPHVAYDLQSDWVATDSSLICSIDMLTATPYASSKVESVPVRLTASRDCQLHAIVGYFDVDFLGNGDPGVNVSFSTGPLSQVTHWGQTVFYLRTPISLLNGQSAEFSVSIGPPLDSPRSLRVAFHWRNGTCSEYLMK